MKKLLSILLVLSMILSFAACADTGKPVDGTDPVDGTSAGDITDGPGDTTVDEGYDELPEKMDYKGETVKLLSATNGGYNIEITVSDYTGDTIYDKVVDREYDLEDRFNIKIENDIKDYNNDDFLNAAIAQIAADEDTYKMWSTTSVMMVNLMIEGYLQDLYTIEQFNFDKPYWNSDFADTMAIGDSLYMATGSLSYYSISNCLTTFFNKTMASELAVKDPKYSPDNIYQLVKDGKWTFDTLLELSAGLYYDANGDSQRNDGDRYGLIFSKAMGYGSIEAMWSSFDIDVFTKTDDFFELGVNEEKMYNALNMMYEAVNMNPDCTDDVNIVSFKDGNSLFCFDYLAMSTIPLLRQQMEDEYGILPYPKYDENQDRYYTFSNQITCYAIPTTNHDTELIANLLEALQSYAYRINVPTALDVALKGKYLSDPDSAAMVDIIVNNINNDAFWSYYQALDLPFQTQFSEAIWNGENNFASTYEGLKTNFGAASQVVKDKIQKNLG